MSGQTRERNDEANIKRILINAKVSKNDKDKIEHHCKKNHISQSELIRTATLKYIDENR